MKRGLPYGWWKSPTFWDVVLLLVTGAALALIIAAWFLGSLP